MPITYSYGQSDNQPDFLEAGNYPAVAEKAVEKQSKSGNNMIEICWRCDNGFPIWDHLVDKDTCRWKSDQLLDAVGKAPEKGKEVTLDADVITNDQWRVNLKVILRDGKNEIEGYEKAEDKLPDSKSF